MLMYLQSRMLMNQIDGLKKDIKIYETHTKAEN